MSRSGAVARSVGDQGAHQPLHRRLSTGWQRRSARGSVTAETAIVLPLLVAFVVGLVWLVSLGVTQARCVDAAREAARALARGDSQQVAVELANRGAPEGAQVSVHASDQVVEVTVSVQTKPPGVIFAMLPSVRLTSTAVSAVEQRDAQGE